MRRLTLCLLPVVLLVDLGCGSDPAAPSRSQVLAVETATTGTETDPDGYVVRVDGLVVGAMAATDTLVLTTLEAGVHDVQLEGLASGCVALGGAVRSVTVVPGDSARATFAVRCASLWASLRVTTSTTGSAPDAMTYELAVDGHVITTVGAHASVLLDSLPPGPHTLSLIGLPTSCRLQGGPERAVALPPDATVEVSLVVACPLVGMRVTLTTSGTDPDLDGYDLLVDAAPVVHLMANDALNVTTAAGVHQVGLQGLAPNCVLAGEALRTVTVPTDGVVAVDLAVECRSLISGPAQLLFFGGPTPTHLYRANGSGAVDLTPTTDGTSGRWSPDRSRLVFSSIRRGGPFPEIFVRPAGDGAANDAAATPLSDGWSPAWSPDGSWIVFATRSGLSVMRADGSQLATLTSNWTDDQPAWSPDGRLIAFVRRQTQISGCVLVRFDPVCPVHVHTMAPDGSGVRDLGGGPTIAADPAWSPDGTRIAVSLAPILTRLPAIWVMRKDGTSLALLGGGDGRARTSPVWSPDGATLAVAENTGDGFRPFLVPATGGPSTPIDVGVVPGFPSSWR